jgi:hypothetical protein
MKITIVSLTLAAAIFPSTAICAEPPGVMQIIREAVKEGRGAAHRKVETDWSRAFRRAKFPYHSLALETMTGTNEVWFLLSYPSFAAIEESDNLIEKGPLKNEVEMLEARDGELRSSSRSMIAVYRKDMSYHPERANLGKTRYMAVNTFRVKLGHTGDFVAGSKMFLAAYEKMNFPHASIVYQVVGGAPQGMFLFFMPLETLKTMDSMAEVERALPAAMGPEEFGRLMKGAGDVFTSMEGSYFRISPQMSYVSKETEDADAAFWRPKISAKPASDAKAKEKPGA